MPIYEYECRKCKERFEVIQKVDEDNSEVRCPKCYEDKPQKVLSTFSSKSVKSCSTCLSGST
jgi:putative FmdB family regulatory protein